MKKRQFVILAASTLALAGAVLPQTSIAQAAGEQLQQQTQEQLQQQTQEQLQAQDKMGTQPAETPAGTTQHREQVKKAGEDAKYRHREQVKKAGEEAKYQHREQYSHGMPEGAGGHGAGGGGAGGGGAGGGGGGR